jgi:hypothetical protein
LWLLSYGSWIYNYLCNQCLSLLMSRSSTNKTDCHNITEILLKVSLNIIKQAQPHFIKSNVLVLYLFVWMIQLSKMCGMWTGMVGYWVYSIQPYNVLVTGPYFRKSKLLVCLFNWFNGLKCVECELVINRFVQMWINANVWYSKRDILKTLLNLSKWIACLILNLLGGFILYGCKG